MTETFYEVLGVAPDATTDEIRAAYRERLKTVHPDVNDDADAEVSTRKLIDARDVLVDEDERERYDRLGHEAYVSGDKSDGESDVARAARDVGYGGEAASDRRQRAHSTVRDARARARERRERERRAAERVSQRRETETTTDGATTGGSGRSTASPGHPSSATSAGGDSTGGPAWATSGGYRSGGSRNWVSTADDWTPSGRDLTLLGITFALYPVLLFSALVPAFPLFVNVVLGACLVLVVGYLQSMPRIALLVFGPWSIVMPFVLVGLNLSLVSLVGIAVLLATWLPFGFTILTISVLRL
jgi:curved DNA-binding protein CbpA